MKVAIIGANGFLGSNLYSFFIEKAIDAFHLPQEMSDLPQKNKSISTNTENTTLAIPFVVAKARFTLLRSVGFTKVC